MSCRVMSLGLGTVLLTHIQQEAQRQGKTVLADFRHTEKNRQMLVAFKFAHFKQIHSDNGIALLQNDSAAILKHPSYIQLTTPDQL
jgi:predicted enzyme involved in methoxymalonyl-ACP biosynthesis